MFIAASGKNGDGDGYWDAAQVSQEKPLAARAVTAIVIGRIRMSGTGVRMRKLRGRVILMCAIVIGAGGRMFLLRTGHALAAGIEFGKGSGLAYRGEEQQEGVEEDGDRARRAPGLAKGLQNATCAMTRGRFPGECPLSCARFR